MCRCIWMLILMDLMGLQSSIWHIADRKKVETLSSGFSIITSHVVDQGLSQRLSLTLRIHMLDIPELVAVCFHVRNTCIVVIDLQDCQTSLLDWARGSISNGTICLLHVLHYCTGAIRAQVRRSSDRLYCTQHIILEGGTSTRAGRTANNDDT